MGHRSTPSKCKVTLHNVCVCVYGSMQHSKAEVNMNAYTILMCQLTLEPLADNVTL